MIECSPKPILIDWLEVIDMCSIQCTDEEIADALRVDYDALSNACKRD